MGLGDDFLHTVSYPTAHHLDHSQNTTEPECGRSGVMCANRRRWRKVSALYRIIMPRFTASFAATIIDGTMMPNKESDVARHDICHTVNAIWQAVLWRIKPLVNYINAQNTPLPHENQ